MMSDIFNASDRSLFFDVSTMAATYKDAGVDLNVYADSMRRIPRLTHRTYCPRVIPNDRGFAGLFSLDFAGKLLHATMSIRSW